MTKILCTGCGGFIGSHLVDRLVSNGADVYVIDWVGSSAYNNGVKQYILKDIRDERAYSELPKIDTIFHLAGISSIGKAFKNPVRAFDINSQGTAMVLEFAAKDNSTVIYTSTSAIYSGINDNPYVYSKWLGEEHCKYYYHNNPQQEIAITRLFNVYGPRQEMKGKDMSVVGIFEDQWLNNIPLTITGTGEKRRDFIHVDDVVDALIELDITTGISDLFQVGTGINVSIKELAAMFSENTRFIPAKPGEADTTLSTERNIVGWTPSRTISDYVKQFKIDYDKERLHNLKMRHSNH